jgi:drug/metabolite transporter (DMT)-like permease
VAQEPRDDLTQLRPPRGGVVFAILAAASFGLSTPFAKLLLGQQPPILLAGLLYLGSGVGLSLLRIVAGKDEREARLGRRDVPWLAGAVFLGGIVGPVLLLLGLRRVPASGASLLLNLEVVFTFLVAWFVFRENFDRRILLGSISIVAGSVVLAWQNAVAFGDLLGPLLIAGACLCWGVDNNLTQKVSAGDPLQIAAIKGLVAGTVNTAIALAMGARVPGLVPLGESLLLGLIGYGLSLASFVRALRDLGAARTGAYYSLAPFLGAALGVLLLREPLRPGFLAGAALMAVGVWLHLTERHDHPHVHERLAHTHRHTHDEHHRHVHAPGTPAGEPHTHPHVHEPITHSHPHYPDIHHRHPHG